MSYYEYLNDKVFLKELDELQERQLYLKATILNFNSEIPIAHIEGKATGGSLNINGKSSLRRSCSCTIAVDESGIQSLNHVSAQKYSNILEIRNLISMNKKVRIEIGVANLTQKYSMYDIIWMPLGVFIIKNASVSKNLNNFTISLTLHDKAAQLNGTCGGIIPAGTVFSEIESFSDNGLTRSISYPTIIDIIRSIVVEFGGENPANIFINDVPSVGSEVLKWTGNMPVYLDETDKHKLLTLTVPANTGFTTYNAGDIIGQGVVPLVYPGTLECNAGDSVASVLDKIKSVLGNYEWFYDVHGRFCFQKIKNYLNDSVTMNIKTYTANDYLGITELQGTEYSFDNTALITSVAVNPTYDNIKNDFTVWGTAKTASGVDKPIRYHAIFETKPTTLTTLGASIVYKDHRGLWAIATEDNIVEITDKPDTSADINKIYYKLNDSMGTSVTVWRYDQQLETFHTYPAAKTHQYQYKSSITATDWRSSLYLDAVKAQGTRFADKPYYAELISEFPKYYDVTQGKYTGAQDSYEYWLDFIETDGSSQPVSQFSIESIGRRGKVVNDNSVTSLFNADAPKYTYIVADKTAPEKRQMAQMLGLEVIQVAPEVWKYIATSPARNSAFDVVKELIQTHTSYNESITLTTLPIYHLEPNTLIKIIQDDMGINGQYIVQSISIPFAPNGTSTIQATRALQKTI